MTKSFDPNRLSVHLLAGLLSILPLWACGADGDDCADAALHEEIPDAKSPDPMPDAAADAEADGPDASGEPDGGMADADVAPEDLASVAPANVPASVMLEPDPGDEWIFNSARCDSEPTIDTSNGTVGGCGDAGGYAYVEFTQSDETYGPLPAALFVTNRFVIEQGLRVRVVGNRPLVVVALDEASISGQLESTVGAIYEDEATGGGAHGAEVGEAGLGPGGGGRSVNGSGGGGGSYCGVGGNGLSTGGDVAAGGDTYGSPENVPLLGGSSAGAGLFQASPGGGGAIQISAGRSLVVTGLGVIHVGGGGGAPGGSGGGSGGAILLEAPSVRIAGTLAANGGGAGESGLRSGGQAASPDDVAAAGGEASDDGLGSGGDGSAGATVNGGAGQMPTGGTRGSGGGGGAGRIRLNSDEGKLDTTGSTISPALDTECSSSGTL